jgi:hypothetical protein
MKLSANSDSLLTQKSPKIKKSPKITTGDLEMKTILMLMMVTLLAKSAVAFNFSDTITCHARVALNRVYFVELHRPSKELIVTADSGTKWEGTASKNTSASTGRETYNVNFFNYSNTAPERMALEIFQDGEHRLCITQTQCFICK